LAWNIAHNLLRRGAVLYQEAELLLREELKEPRVYYSILRAIADGSTRAGEIASRVGMASDLTPYLRTLAALDLVTYREPLHGKGRRGVWTIADPYLHFYFTFLLPHRAALEHGAQPEQVYRDVVAPRLDHYVSKPVFEDICRSWLRSQAARGALPWFVDVGAWWGAIAQPTPENPRHSVEAEVEVVAFQGNALQIVGEAKWTREPVGLSVLNHLRAVAHSIAGAQADTRLILFGRAFNERLVTVAMAEGVRLVGLDDLYGTLA